MSPTNTPPRPRRIGPLECDHSEIVRDQLTGQVLYWYDWRGYRHYGPLDGLLLSEDTRQYAQPTDCVINWPVADSDQHWPLIVPFMFFIVLLSVTLVCVGAIRAKIESEKSETIINQVQK